MIKIGFKQQSESYYHHIIFEISYKTSWYFFFLKNPEKNIKPNKTWVLLKNLMGCFFCKKKTVFSNSDI